MLMSDMKETSTGIIRMEDVDVNIMDAFIEYLHLKSVHNLDEIAVGLFDLADKYQISDLKVDQL